LPRLFHLGRPSGAYATAAGFDVETAAGVRVAARACVIAAGRAPSGRTARRSPASRSSRGAASSISCGAAKDFRGRRVVVAAAAFGRRLGALARGGCRAGDVVHRRAKFRAAPQSAVRLQALADEGRIELVIPYQLHALEGADGQLSAVIVAVSPGGPAGSRPIASCRFRTGH